ncbi:MAG: DUF1059 domain-containing protein [Gemmatirosa sp.]|nr:DUF1059 domain-containing protein [Gemmatirosa sp.]
MAEKQVACDCGTVIREKTDAQLIAAVQQHAQQIHGLSLTPEQILAMAEVP